MYELVLELVYDVCVIKERLLLRTTSSYFKNFDLGYNRRQLILCCVAFHSWLKVIQKRNVKVNSWTRKLHKDTDPLPLIC